MGAEDIAERVQKCYMLSGACRVELKGLFVFYAAMNLAFQLPGTDRSQEHSED
jgi:hypothetical protein